RRELEALGLEGAPPMLVAVGELLRATVALRTLRSGPARAAIERAAQAAHRARIPALLAEVEAARGALAMPVARVVSAAGERSLALEGVEALLESPALIVDACRRDV